MQYMIYKVCDMRKPINFYDKNNKRNVYELNKLPKHVNFSMRNISFAVEYLQFYSSGFNKIMKYHELGLAAVDDKSSAYHININGLPNYPRQFLEHMVFERLDAVRDKTECFHIKPDEKECYPACY